MALDASDGVGKRKVWGQVGTAAANMAACAASRDWGRFRMLSRAGVGLGMDDSDLDLRCRRGKLGNDLKNRMAGRERNPIGMRC